MDVFIRHFSIAYAMDVYDTWVEIHLLGEGARVTLVAPKKVAVSLAKSILREVGEEQP